MFRGFGRALEGRSGEGIQSGRNRFFDGLGGGSWEGKNQRNPMKGSLILSLRVGAGKGVWSSSGGLVFEPSGGRWKGGLERPEGEKSMPWLGFRNDFDPPKTLPKEGSRRPPKAVRGRG